MTVRCVGELDDPDPMRAARKIKRLTAYHKRVELWHDIEGLLWCCNPPTRGTMVGTYDEAARAYHIAQDIDCARDEWEGRKP